MPSSKASRRAVIACCTAALWLAAMGVAAQYLRGSENRSRRAMTARLQTRIAAGAEFAELYVRDIFKSERVQASMWLSGRHPTGRQLALTARTLGAADALLLDSRGHVIADEPSQAGLHGVDVALAYRYLARAEAGHAIASDVIIDDGAPVVAFAIPFATQHGRRVLSIAFPASQTPLSEFAAHLLSAPGHRVFVVDGAGNLIATSSSDTIGASLSRQDPELAQAVRGGVSGTYTRAGRQEVFVRDPIPGEAWQVVASEPAGQLFLSIDGSGRTLSWVALGGLTLAGLIIIAIGARLARSRARLLELTGELERLARIDSLTEVTNRRGLEERLNAAIRTAHRNQGPLSVLLADIDHFKRVNDTLGHHTGDSVLVAAANAMRGSLRLGDTLGRWGGEEFLAILPDTDAETAAGVAQRLRVRVRESVTAGECPVTVTIGVAHLDHTGSVATLVGRADAALYAGKASGRDTVQVVLAPSAPAPADVLPSLV